MMTFREFFYGEVPEQQFSDLEVANMYFQGQTPVREIARTSHKSIREVYRIIRQYGQPNRTRQDQHNVISLADSGLGSQTIADLTGYTSRQVRNILSKNRFLQ
jgi:hypothetical protein